MSYLSVDKIFVINYKITSFITNNLSLRSILVSIKRKRKQLNYGFEDYFILTTYPIQIIIFKTDQTQNHSTSPFFVNITKQAVGQLCSVYLPLFWGIDPRGRHKPGKHCTTELQLCFGFNFLLYPALLLSFQTESYQFAQAGLQLSIF